ncbi:MAG TPA: histidine phosphatase family protein [Pyrinomonadaceae bacterium]|nr:histidine phosphatase family protein [Pyrinomonadaceae bacterium]
MKRLLLLRHAKSSWGDPSLADFDRPLNERGLRAAPLMGRHMLERKLRPGLVLSSPAERARRTAELVVEAARITAPLRFDERIYEATPARLVEVVSQSDESADEVLVVGHNPGTEELIELLTGESRRVPTAALARIRLDIEKWSELRPERSGRLEWLVRPKDLEE